MATRSRNNHRLFARGNVPATTSEAVRARCLEADAAVPTADPRRRPAHGRRGPPEIDAFWRPHRWPAAPENSAFAGTSAASTAAEAATTSGSGKDYASREPHCPSTAVHRDTAASGGGSSRSAARRGSGVRAARTPAARRGSLEPGQRFTDPLDQRACPAQVDRALPTARAIAETVVRAKRLSVAASPRGADAPLPHEQLRLCRQQAQCRVIELVINSAILRFQTAGQRRRCGGIGGRGRVASGPGGVTGGREGAASGQWPVVSRRGRVGSGWPR